MRDPRAPPASMSLSSFPMPSLPCHSPGPHFITPGPSVLAPLILQQCQSPALDSPTLPGYGPQPRLALAHSCPQWGAWSPGLGLPLMPPGLPSSLAGMVGCALLGSCCHSWKSWLFLCPDNYLVFILLTCQRCVMRCKIKMKTCQEPMRCVLGAALPLPCISSFHCSYWCHLCFHLLLSPKTLLGCVLEGYTPAASASCCLAFHAPKHCFPVSLQQYIESQLWCKMLWFLFWCYYKFLVMQTYLELGSKGKGAWFFCSLSLSNERTFLVRDLKKILTWLFRMSNKHWTMSILGASNLCQPKHWYPGNSMLLHWMLRFPLLCSLYFNILISYCCYQNDSKSPSPKPAFFTTRAIQKGLLCQVLAMSQGF